MIRITVFCTTQFEGFHCWPNAPRHVDYLRSVHRHIFHVRAEKRVTEEDREIEFITLKKNLDSQIAILKVELECLPLPTWSCETWARMLVERLQLSKCEVSEDGENGAVVEVCE